MLCLECIPADCLLPENQFPVIVVPANAVEMQHRRIIEKRQSHRIQQDMCPKGEWSSAREVLLSVNCSSIEMRIVDNQRRASAGDYVVFLLDSQRIRKQILKHRKHGKHCIHRSAGQSKMKLPTVYSLYQLFQLIDFSLNSQLSKYVVVLNTVQEL